MAGADDGGGPVGDREDGQVVGAQQNYVGVLAGRDAARSGAESARGGGVDGGEGKQVAGAQAAVQTALDGEGGTHGGEHVATGGGDVVDGQGRAQSGGQRPAGHRVAEAHLQLDVRADRQRAPRVGEHPQFLVAEPVAVHEGGGVPQEAVLTQIGDSPAHDVHMQAGAQAEFVRQLQLVGDGVHAGGLGAPESQGHGDRAVVAELGADAANGGVDGVGGAPAGAEAEDRPSRRVAQRGDGGVLVLGGLRDVVPVQHGGHAGVEGLQAAEEGARVDVLGPVVGFDRAVHGHRPLGERPVRADASERGLPGVAVVVDEAGHDDPVGRVDHLGVRRVDAFGDLDDHAVLDEHVTAGEIADSRVHADHGAATEQGFHRMHSFTDFFGWGEIVVWRP